MPTIYDNIQSKFETGLKQHIENANRVDYCAGYFNIRGWSSVCDKVDKLVGMEVLEGETKLNRFCRLLVGMTKTPQDILIESFESEDDLLIDMEKANKFKKKLAQDFRDQLTIGTPSDNDERTIRKLYRQLKAGKVVVKLFLRHQLHAKLYLAYSNNKITPKLALLGSSNFTFAGLQAQGELNVDVLEQDAAIKLANWFDDRWNDRWCIDITTELIKAIEDSWAREDDIPPYFVYLKMAYHLSQEARSGISEFKLPKVFQDTLLDFQQKAVQIAAHHLNKRNGVMIGDVVGLGKTITAVAIAKLLEEDQILNTLILCPKNLIEMWRGYVEKYGLHAKIVPHSMVIKDLTNLRRYKLIIIDESHNFRNSENKQYKAIKSYIEQNDSKVILLSATPYNKSYYDLANQLKLFLSEDFDLGISPEHYINEIGGVIQFHSLYSDTPIRSIKAFEKSANSDDWRDLMKQYLVRRTRSFIKDNYASTDNIKNRKYLEFANGKRSYFPDRIPKKVAFAMNEKDNKDQYAMLYHSKIVSIIDSLELPRYSMLTYISSKPTLKMTKEEELICENLSRAGKRTKGFCRTNLYKRLESSGYAFLLSVSRLILRNYIIAYALENKLSIPIGGQSVDVDVYSDMDDEDLLPEEMYFNYTVEEYQEKAREYYQLFETKHKSNFLWIRPEHFDIKSIYDCLILDNDKLHSILKKVPEWNPDNDRKLTALYNLLNNQHTDEKVLVFTQFADTAEYLNDELLKRGITNIGLAVGGSNNITSLVQRFSPISNEIFNMKGTENELRILISTDVLSEGQNLQDAHIVVNFDLPWAIIRLIQRAGRVDRLGQESERILCYSFLPEDGIEKIIGLRQKLKKRINDNAEVVGSDEVFFDGDPINIADLYSEKSGILDEQDDNEVDLASYAYQIWKNAIDNKPELKDIIANLSNVVFSTKYNTIPKTDNGVIIYAKTYENNDVMTWLDDKGNMITQSQYSILRAAECNYECQIAKRLINHHDLVKKGVDMISKEERNASGTLGRKHGIKYRSYMMMKRYIDENDGTLLVTEQQKKALDDIYKYPLKEHARDVIARQMKTGISDASLCELVASLKEEDKLCTIEASEIVNRRTQIICSLGMVKGDN